MYAELDTLGKRVKYFREQKKLSQAQLANMVLAKDKNNSNVIKLSHINYKSN